MSETAVIRRKCSVCGREIPVKLHSDGTYEGGHYFGSVKEGMIELGRYDPKHPDEEYEYWECEECFKEASERVKNRDELEKLYIDITRWEMGFNPYPHVPSDKVPILLFDKGVKMLEKHNAQSHYARKILSRKNILRRQISDGDHVLVVIDELRCALHSLLDSEEGASEG